MKTEIKKTIKRLIHFWNHHINETTFKIKWKLDGGIYVKYRSLKTQSREESLRNSVSKAIVTLVKILKENSDDSTQEEVLEPFKIAVAREFGVTEEEYRNQKVSDDDETKH